LRARQGPQPLDSLELAFCFTTIRSFPSIQKTTHLLCNVTPDDKVSGEQRFTVQPRKRRIDGTENSPFLANHVNVTTHALHYTVVYNNFLQITNE
jgi:hypothetical protein